MLKLYFASIISDRKEKDRDPDPYLWLMEPDQRGPKTCGSCWPGKFTKRPGVNPIVRRRDRLPLIEKKVPRLLANVILVARASHIVVAAPRHPPPLLELCAADRNRCRRLLPQQNIRPRAPAQQQGLPAAAQHFCCAYPNLKRTKRGEIFWKEWKEKCSSLNWTSNKDPAIWRKCKFYPWFWGTWAVD